MGKLNNRKREKFAQKMVENMEKGVLNPAQAYQEAYPNANIASAKDRSVRILKEDVGDRIRELMEEKGLSLETTLDKVKDLSNAQRPLVVNKSVHFVPDNSTQVEMAKTVLKLHGYLENKKEAPQIDARQVNITVNNETKDDLQGILGALNELNSKLLVDDGSQTGEVIDANMGK